MGYVIRDRCISHKVKKKQTNKQKNAFRIHFWNPGELWDRTVCFSLRTNQHSVLMPDVLYLFYSVVDYICFLFSWQLYDLMTSRDLWYYHHSKRPLCTIAKFDCNLIFTSQIRPMVHFQPILVHFVLCTVRYLEYKLIVKWTSGMWRVSESVMNISQVLLKMHLEHIS